MFHGLRQPPFLSTGTPWRSPTAPTGPSRRLGGCGSNLIGELASHLDDGEAFVTFLQQEGCASPLAFQTLEQVRDVMGSLRMLLPSLRRIGPGFTRTQLRGIHGRSDQEDLVKCTSSCLQSDRTASDLVLDACGHGESPRAAGSDAAVVMWVFHRTRESVPACASARSKHLLHEHAACLKPFACPFLIAMLFCT